MSVLKNPVTANDHIQGPENASFTLVEYGDYQCPYCGAAYPIIKEIQGILKDTLRFVFRNFPLTEAHPYAEAAAKTAEFAGDHQKFWQMHDALYENQGKFSFPFFKELANEMHLPSTKLDEILKHKSAYDEKIRSDFMSGVRSGVNGTPTFFINGQRYNGPVESQALVAAIHAAVPQT